MVVQALFDKCWAFVLRSFELQVFTVGAPDFPERIAGWLYTLEDGGHSVVGL